MLLLVQEFFHIFSACPSSFDICGQVPQEAGAERVGVRRAPARPLLNEEGTFKAALLR